MDDLSIDDLKDLPPHRLYQARKAGLTRHSEPIEKDGVKNIRTALYDWDQICGDNHKKKDILRSEAFCEQLVMRSMPYDPYDFTVGGELATMGEKWASGIKAMSNFYDKDENLFKLWLNMNLVSPVPFIYQYMVPFELLFQILKSYKKVEKEVVLLKAVHLQHNVLYQ